MARARAGLLAAALLLLPLPAPAGEDAPPPVPAGEARALFAWFDTLGLPDGWGKPFGLVARGACMKSGDDPWEAVREHGFLLEDRGGTFRVLTVGLEVREFAKSPGADPVKAGADRVSFEPADLADEADALLRGALDDIRRNVSRMYGPHTSGVSVPLPVRLLAFARASSARGREDAARALLAAAGRLAGRGRGTLREGLEPHLGQVLHGRLVEALADPAVPRAEVLARAETVRKAFEETAVAAPFRTLAGNLRRMVEEDAAHRPPEGFPEACSRDALAREWAWRLRDQRGSPWSQPGACDVFADPDAPPGPAQRLLDMGTDAVPALLGAMEDGSWLRGMDESWGTPTPVTVGTGARQVLARISGRWFAERPEAEAWWTAVRAKGLDAVLAEGVLAGGAEAVEQARVLAARSPKAAAEAIAAGLGRCTHEFARADLVDILGGLPGDAALPSLLAEAAASPFLSARVRAAWELRKRGRPEGVEAMIDAWRNAKPVYGVDDVLRFLGECGDPGALRALGESLPRVPVPWRVQALLAIHGGAAGERDRPAPGPEWREEAERILAGRLGDRAQWMGYLGGVADLSLRDPRVCDVAASVLGRMRGAPGALDLGASVAARDRACARLANAWRKGRGLDPLPEPARPEVPAPGKAVEGLLRAAAAAEDAGARADALAALRAEGLGALAPVDAALASLPAGHPARGDLEALARDLAFTVREAAADPAGLPVPEAARSLLEGMRGRPLRPEDLAGLLVAVLKGLPEGAEGLSLLVDRPEDGTGAVLLLAVLPAGSAGGPGMTPPPGGWPRESSPGGWGYQEAVVRAGKSLLGSSGSAAADHLLGPRGWEDLAEALREGLRAGPREPLEVRVRVTRQ